MTGLVHFEREGSVVRLTLNDEPTRNSLSIDMMKCLSDAIGEASLEADVGAIVIASRGKAFCSGHNLKELSAHRADADNGLGFFTQTFSTCASLMTSIAYCPRPVIAEVDGMASAAGCQLVATCDLAYASPRASFCTPGVNIGLFCSTPMVALSRNVRPKHALEMLLTGSVFGAEHAARIGLVNEVVVQNELREHVMHVAGLIAGKSRSAIGIGKRAFHDQAALGLENAYALTSAVMAKNMLEGAACEGIDAFLSKRSPIWPAE